MSAAVYNVVYRSTLPPQLTAKGVVSTWHHDSYHANRPSAEKRASALILSGLQVRILEVQ